jgi:bifunctional ADP-heptose synthase (sugar kinase/adenylyltransferase)
MTRLAAVLLLMFGICRVPGGSAANVMKGLANISAGSVHCRFMGMVGTDAVATDYMAKLKQQNVHPVLLVRLWNCPQLRKCLLSTRSLPTSLSPSLPHARSILMALL